MANSKKPVLEPKIELLRTKILGSYECDRCGHQVVLKKQIKKKCIYYHCYHCGETRFYYTKTLYCFCHSKKATEFKETRNEGWLTYYCPEHNVRIFSKKEWVNQDLYKINPSLAMLQNVKEVAKTIKTIRR